MIATPAEVSALVAAGWVPSRYSIWTAEGEVTLLRRGDEVLHVTISTPAPEPQPAADTVTLLLPPAAPEHDADGVTLFIPAGPHWTSPQPERLAPVATGSAQELIGFRLGPSTSRRSRRAQRGGRL